MDRGVQAGIAIAALFAVAAVVFTLYACVKKGRHLLGYSRDIVEYQTVHAIDDDDDYDSDYGHDMSKK